MTYCSLSTPYLCPMYEYSYMSIDDKLYAYMYADMAWSVLQNGVYGRTGYDIFSCF